MLRLLVIAVLLTAMLFIEAPAWLVAERVADETGRALELRNAAGTVWRGNADAVLTALTGPIALGRIGWRVIRIDLTNPAVVVEIEQTPAAPRVARLTVSSERRTLSGSARAPAAVVTALPQASALTLGGSLLADTDALEWTAAGAAGRATIRWQNATIGGLDLQAVPLGDVTAQVDVGATGVAASIVNAGGAAQLNASIDAKSGVLDVQIAPRPDTPPALVRWLQSRLPRGADGRHMFRFTLPQRR